MGLCPHHVSFPRSSSAPGSACPPPAPSPRPRPQGPQRQCLQVTMCSPHITHILAPLLAEVRPHPLMTILFQNSTSSLYQTFTVWHLITFCPSSFTIPFSSLSLVPPHQTLMSGVLGHGRVHIHPQNQAHKGCSIMEICIFSEIHPQPSPSRSQGKQHTQRKLLHNQPTQVRDISPSYKRSDGLLSWCQGGINITAEISFV